MISHVSPPVRHAPTRRPPERLGSWLHVAALAALGCSGASPADESQQTDLETTCPRTTEAIQKEILEPNCGLSGCHGSEEPAQDLDLVSAELEARIVGRVGLCQRPLIVAGNSSGSYLMTKVTHPSPSCGDPMPLDRDSLSDHEVQCLSSWIEQLSPAIGSTDSGSEQAPDTNGTGTKVDAGPAVDAASAPPAPSCEIDEMRCGDRCVTKIEPTFDALYDAIAAKTCVFDSCHGGIRPKEGLDMKTADAAYDSLVSIESQQQPDRSLVEPGDPGRSYLIDKLRGENLGEQSNGTPSERMPKPPNKPMCEEKIQLFEQWIDDGAPR